jgi:muramidase (phage lysozyme)
MTSYADHPRSITEVQADKSNDASKATPRDALITILRDIDAGKIKPAALVICWCGSPEDGAIKMGFEAASPDLITTLGLLTRTVSRIIDD